MVREEIVRWDYDNKVNILTWIWYTKIFYPLNFKNWDVRFRQKLHGIRKSTAFFVASDTSS